MSRASSLLAALVVSSLPVLALEPPIRDARIELAAGTDPAAAVAAAGAEPTWIGWTTSSVSADARLCCGFDHGRVRGCSLADEDGGLSADRHDRRPETTGELVVLAEACEGRVRRLRLVTPDCPVDGAGKRVVWLGRVETDRSLELVERLVDSPDDEVAEPALSAVAFHAGERPDRFLDRVANDAARPGGEREQALFWAGHLRGARGYELLDRFLASGADADLRSHALFALTQSADPRASGRLKEASARDRSDEVRGQGLFWLAQSEAPEAAAWIRARIDADPSAEVREQAVFALSQLDDGADHLLALMRSSRDPAVVRQAFFWLGQSEDPRAIAAIEEVLLR